MNKEERIKQIDLEIEALTELKDKIELNQKMAELDLIRLKIKLLESMYFRPFWF